MLPSEGSDMGSTPIENTEELKVESYKVCKVESEKDKPLSG